MIRIKNVEYIFLSCLFTFIKQMPLPLPGSKLLRVPISFLFAWHIVIGAASRSLPRNFSEQKRLSFRPASPAWHDPIPPRACNRVPFMLIGNPSAFNQLRQRHCLANFFLRRVPRACFVTSHHDGKQPRTRPSPRHPDRFLSLDDDRRKKRVTRPRVDTARLARGVSLLGKNEGRDKRGGG